MKLPETIGDWMIAGLIVFLISIAGIFLITKLADVAIPGGVNSKVSSEEELYLDQTTGKFVVPIERVPTTIEEFATAPAIVLDPSRIQGGYSDRAQILPGERQILARQISAFLTEWENFDPLRNRVEWAGGDYQLAPRTSYLSRLRKFSSTSTDLERIAARSESADPPGVCSDCERGLGWVSGGDIAKSMKVVAYERRRAFVVLSGIVQVRDQVNPASYYNRALYSRSYSIYLYRQGERWLVKRIVASSLPLG